MANGYEIGKAYIQIVPTTNDIKPKLTEAMNGGAKDAGKSAGEKAGSSFGSAFSSAMKGIGSIMATTAKGFADAVSEVADVGDNVDKMSQKLGLSTAAYQEWDYVLNLAGTSMQNMSTGMKTLTNVLDDAKNGSADAQAKFAALGISMEDLNTMSREEAFNATITGFQGMADSTERAALANDLFGRSGQELTPLFNTTAEETAEMIANANEYNMVMGEEAVKASAAFKDSLTTLETSFNGLKNNLMAEFLPACTSVTDGLTLLFNGDYEGGAEKIKSGISEITNQVSEMLPEIMELAGEILTSLAGALADNLPIILDGIINVVSGIAAAIPDILPALLAAVLTMITEICSHLSEILEPIIAMLPDLIKGVLEGLANNIDSIVTGIVDCVIMILDNLPEIIAIIVECIPKIVIALIIAIFENLPQIITSIWDCIGEIAVAIGQGLVNLWTSTVWPWLSGVFTDIGEWFVEVVGSVKTFVTETIPSKIKEGLEGIKEAGSSLITGLWNGINDKIAWIKEKIMGFGETILSTIKGIFGIHSPSTEMAWMGDMLMEGMSLGIDRSAKIAVESAVDAADEIGGVFSGMTTEYTANIAASGMGYGAVGGNTFNVTTYGAEGQNVNDLADIVIDKMQRMIEGQGRVYA